MAGRLRFGVSMTQYANIQVGPNTDGLVYALNTPLTSTESDLFNQQYPAQLDPISVTFGEAILAIVQITALGGILTDTAYCVLQTDLGDGVWVDCAWCLTTETSGEQTFVLSAGIAGNNAFQQTRQPGTAPGSNGSNQMALGGRIRFVGKATVSQSSSSSASPGVVSIVQVTIKYKLLGLR
jgi:hypothetical protein